MPKQSAGQKKTMERVMHEFKEGELESGSGKKVKSRKQAIAIGLKESGASKNASTAENKKNLAKTKQKERAGKTGSAKKATGKTTASKTAAAKSTAKKTSAKKPAVKKTTTRAAATKRKTAATRKSG